MTALKLITVDEAKCPVCKRWVNLAGARLTTHGPGRGTFTCPGGSTYITIRQKIRKRQVEVEATGAYAFHQAQAALTLAKGDK